ncbi:hypothetical protein BDZ97DRAFT_1864936 [Flammula alnicola]|nr:hypothetical protein BDZ97DRAFT_1864936 [Flammula alnicola]
MFIMKIRRAGTIWEFAVIVVIVGHCADGQHEFATGFLRWTTPIPFGIINICHRRLISRRRFPIWLTFFLWQFIGKE